MKFDMLAIKRDRLSEISKQIIRYANKKDWNKVRGLRHEQRDLKAEIKDMEIRRGII